MPTESASLSEYSNISLGLNDSFIIKRLFLSFLQAYFAQHSKFTWTSGNNTRILILDKYSMDVAPLESKPAIIISRGYMRFLGTSIGQRLESSLWHDNVRYTDILSGSITFNCLAKNGLVCEELALTVRNAIIGYKNQLKQNGLHTINTLVIGDERQVKGDSDIVLQVVPVELEFTKQSFISSTEDFYTTNVKIQFSGTAYGAYSGLIFSTEDLPLQAFENQQYTVFESGIVFVSGFAPPTGATLSLSFIEPISLNEVTEVPSGLCNGTNRTYYSSQAIYGYSPLLTGVTLSGITFIND